MPVGILHLLLCGGHRLYSNLPYLPWWADGMAVTLMLMLPVLFTFSGKERKAIPVVLFNALLFGFLISAAEKYLA